eukprot:GHRR01001791.1.p1 GENE.GHRR01001791.1~~GHRR01001791.1.p1  ORF type:complete len:649 (+),score=181.74 GHRR01001791.1:2802-4748(+)
MGACPVAFINGSGCRRWAPARSLCHPRSSGCRRNVSADLFIVAGRCTVTLLPIEAVPGWQLLKRPTDSICLLSNCLTKASLDLPANAVPTQVHNPIIACKGGKLQMKAFQQISTGCQHKQRMRTCGVQRHITPCFSLPGRWPVCSTYRLFQQARYLQQQSSRCSYLVRAAIIASAQQLQLIAAAANGTTDTTAQAVTETAADPWLNLDGNEGRIVGSLIGSMCGNALGAQVEPEKHYRIARLFPDGLHDMSWSFDISPDPLPPGWVTGDFVTMLAVGQSLARSGQADVFDILQSLTHVYAPEDGLRYSPYTTLTLAGLAAGSNPFTLAERAEGYLTTTPSRASQSCSHRPDRQLHGTTDYTGVIRAIPIGLAYRNAPVDMLSQAVDAAVLLTHPTEQGREGALAIAAAVAWLTRADPAEATPEQLLEHLLSVTQSLDMTAKLQLLQQHLPQLKNFDHIHSWSQFWKSAHWSHMVNTANLLWKQNLAVQGTQAAAVALWVLLVSWQHPKQAIMLAASLGGFASTTGALTGALVGALHGCKWVPSSWWQQLKDEAVYDNSAEGAKSTAPDDEQQLVKAPTERNIEQQQQAAAQGPASTRQVIVANADAGDAGEVSIDEDEDIELPVSKYSVVLLGQALAKISPAQVAPLV